MDIKTLWLNSHAGGAITSPRLKPGASPLPNPPFSVKWAKNREYLSAIAHFASLILSLGFTREEIEAAYFAKVEENKRRWQEARS